MPPKRKGIAETTITSNNVTNLADISLEKYCPKKLYEVGFINEASKSSQQFLNDLVEKNQSLKNQSCATFITYTDVADFALQSTTPTLNFEFPPSLISSLNELSVDYCEHLKNDEPLPLETIGLITKLKLIQVMYQQYAEEVKKMRKMKQTDDELQKLISVNLNKKETVKKGKQKSDKTSSQNKLKKIVPVASKQIEKEVEDYTDIPLTDLEIIVDDEIHKQINLYIFQEFTDLGIINYLTRYGVIVSFIMQVSENETSINENRIPFWDQLDKVFEYHLDSEFLENTAIVKYVPKNDLSVQSSMSLLTDDELLIYRLNELLNVILNVTNLKRHHLLYIRSLNLCNPLETSYKTSFQKYRRYLKMCPLECITVPLILSGILKEISSSGVERSDLGNSYKNNQIPENENHSCPFSMKLFISKKKCLNEKIETKEPYKVSKFDRLYLTFKSYDEITNGMMEESQKLLKLNKLCAIVGRYSPGDIEVPHVHHQFTPPQKKYVLTSDQTDYIINLLYSTSLNCKSTKTLSNNDEMFPYLITFDETSMREMILPTVIVSDKNDALTNVGAEPNLYQVYHPMKFCFIEKLSSLVLPQRIHTVSEKFICVDYRYCDFTDTLIVKFHNDATRFGTNTRLWNQSIRTPVCFRDFCKYVVMEENEWMKNTMPIPQIKYFEVKNYNEEIAINKAHTQESYQQYSKFLNPQIQYSDSVTKRKCKCPTPNACGKITKTLGNKSDEKFSNLDGDFTPNLEIIIDELKNYPTSDQINNYCSSSSNNNFTGYDFGPKRVALMGYTTDFFSHDGVRVCVDTSRFLHDPFKMAASIHFNSNDIYFHIPKQDFEFHMSLFDGTIISFQKPKINYSKTTKENSFSETIDVTQKVINVSVNQGSLKPSKNKGDKAKIKPTKPDVEKTIKAISDDEFQLLNLFPVLGNTVREKPSYLYQTNIAKDVEILQKVVKVSSSYKVSKKKCHKLSHLKRKTTENVFPLSKVVYRILNNSRKQKKCLKIRRKCIVVDKPNASNPKRCFNVVLTMPNGLNVKSIASELRSGYTDIKQSYPYNKHFSKVKAEQYRYFINTGSVIIAYSDGTIELLLACGKSIKFSEPTTQSIRNHEKYCRKEIFKDTNLFRKKLTKLIENNARNQNSTGYERFPSRRGHLSTKINPNFYCEELEHIFDSNFPFLKIDVTKFDGKKLTVKKNRFSQNMSNRQFSDYDFKTEEQFFEREDGFCCLLDRNARQTVRFPDGTVIIYSVHIRNKPVFFDKYDKEGWVVVDANYRFEHPHYLPILFNDQTKSSKICINQKYVLSIFETEMNLNFGDNIYLDIDQKNVCLNKMCDKCRCGYTCSVNIKPLFYNTELTDINDNFLTVEDSYDKQFTANFKGRCTENQNYLTGKLNKLKCDHYRTCEWQQIYFLKKDLSGLMLWDNEKLYRRTKNSKEDSVLETLDDEFNLASIQFVKNFFAKYNERYFQMYSQPKLMLSKNATNEEKKIIYQTFRKICRMITEDEISDIFIILKNYFNNTQSISIANSLTEIIERKQNIRVRAKQIADVNKVSQKPQRSDQFLAKAAEYKHKYQSAKRLFKKPIPAYFQYNVDMEFI